MPVAAALGAAGAAAALGSTIANATSGGPGSGFSSGSSPPPAYIPTAQPGMDQSYQNIFGGISPYVSGSSSLIPGQIGQYQQFAGNITGSPYAQGALTGAQQGAQYGMGILYPQLTGGAAGLYGLGQQGVGPASQILQTGFDPQQALYNRTQQQVQDQSNAINSMYGLGSSPAGAGLTQQALSNFNIDWQNQQLGRQAQAASAYGGLLGNIGRGYSGAADLGSAAMNLPVTAGGLPYQTQLGIDTNALNALNTAGSGYSNALNLGETALNPLAAYLRLGQTATQVGQTGAAQNFANNQALGQGFGSALQSLSGLFNNQSSVSGGSGGGGGGGGQPSSANYYTTDPAALQAYQDATAYNAYGYTGF